MNESPWQPPSGDGLDADPPVPPSPVPPPPTVTVPPSPWSPEGAAAWTSSAPQAGDRVAMPEATSPGIGEPADRASHEGPVNPTAPSRRPRAVVAGVVVAVLAAGLAGVFAVQRFSGEEAGGAASADELGRELMAAVEAEDVLGVIDTMLPGEREALGEPFVEMVGELQRLEVLSADTDLSRLLGVDVELTDEVVDVRGTNVPDIVGVSMEAQAMITLDGATLPLGTFLEDQLPDEALAELRGSRLSERQDFSLELAAVQQGERWYFSLFHTVAELARADAGSPPIPVDGIAPHGADSPEAAVDLSLDLLEQLDVRGLIAVLDPAEAAALQRYAPLFLDDAEAAVAELPLDWQVDERELRIEGDGGERTVFVDALRITGTVDGSPLVLDLRDGCVRGELGGETFEECGAVSDDLETILADAPAAEAFLRSVADAFADLEPIGLQLRERDGAWYVSPLATGTEAMLAVLRALDRTELDTLVTDGQAAFEEFAAVFLGGLDVFEGGLGVDEESVFEGELDDDALAVVPDEGASDPWQECAFEPDPTDALACFDRYVATGEFDASLIPAELLYPECGLVGFWTDDLYDASDEEFTATVDAAVPCFQDLVDRSVLETWQLPFAVLFVDCFEGRNWYATDDADYNRRVDACIAGE